MGMDNPKITQIPQDDFMDVLEIGIIIIEK